MPREAQEAGREAEEDRLYKEAGLYFRKPDDCIVELERRVSYQRYGEGRQRGQKQVQCAKCRRWKYPNQRCNLFTPVSANAGQGQ